MVFVDYALGIPSPKLQVPNKFKVSLVENLKKNPSKVESIHLRNPPTEKYLLTAFYFFVFSLTICSQPGTIVAGL